jgi:hypothetical protein
MNTEGTLILTRQDIVALMNFTDYVSAVEAGFRLYTEGHALLPGLLHIDAPDGAFHFRMTRFSTGRPRHSWSAEHS